MATQAINEVAICNLGLGLLQQAQITSIETPVSNAEVICALWYHTIRRLTLAGHLWNFAKKRVLLPKLAEAPEFEHDSKYAFPSDYIRLVRFGKLHTDSVDYTIENNEILTTGLGDLTLPIVYIYDFTIVTQMAPLFVDLFAHEFALRTAPFFKADPNIISGLVILRDRLYKKATGVDGQEDKPKVLHRSRMLSARRSVGTV